jgi:hypothetical protein
MNYMPVRKLEGRCVCGYNGEFDKIECGSGDGYGAFILTACVSDPEYKHKGSVPLAVCPRCGTVRIIKK